jgi:hypothetical protein
MIMLGWQTHDNSNNFFMLKDHAAIAISIYSPFPSSEA